MSRRTELAAPPPFRLWKLDLGHWPGEDAIATLSPAERERAQRFRFEHLRRRYLASHVALREAISEFCGEAAAVQAFDEGPHGKPALRSGACAFNMSHSHDVALIGAAPHGEIGVDIEMLREVEDALAIARRNFTPGEYEQLLAAPAHDRDLVFMRLWTRKEACLKAVGSGFSIAPDLFETRAEPDARDLWLPTPQGRVRVHVESLPEADGCAMALAWLLD